MKEKLLAVQKYLVAAVLLAVPLYPKFPFIRVPGTFVSIRLEDFIIAITFFAWFIYIFPSILSFIKLRMSKVFILFLVVTLVSTVSAIFLTKTVDPIIATLHWIRRVEYIIPFFVGYTVIKERKEYLNFYLKTLVIVVFVSFVYGYGQKHFSWPIIITQNMEYSKGVALRWIPGSHINSTFAGHYDLATFLVLVMPITTVALFTLKGRKTRLILLSTFLMGLWLLVNTISRVSVVSYLGSTTLALIFAKKYKAIPIVIVVSIVIFAFSSNLLARYSRILDVVKSKLAIASVTVYAQDATPPPDTKVEDQKPSSLPEDRSSSIRFNVEWPRAIRAFEKNPLLGTGFSSITLATDNDYLRMLGETGILGFLSFVTILLFIATKLLSMFPIVDKFSGVSLAFIAGITGAIPGLLLNAAFIDIFEASKFAILFWLILGFTIGIVDARKE